VRPAVSAAMGLRELLRHDRVSLVKGLMLLAPDQRALLLRVLDESDCPGMSLITDAEQAAEKVFREVEAKVEDLDGEALAEARRLLAEAKGAEAQVLSVILTDRSQLIALAEKYGPELVAAVEAVLQDLLSRMQSLFGLTPPE
jgi:hypothetical protein